MNHIDELRDSLPFPVTLNDVSIEVEALQSRTLAMRTNEAVLRRLLSCIDLTSLNATDSETSIRALVRRVNRFEVDFPDLPNVASVCTWPCYASLLKHSLKARDVRRCVVAAAFPSSQTFQEVKTLEVQLAVNQGAEEVDVVLPIGQMLSGDYNGVYTALRAIREVCLSAKLKVILETSALETADTIWDAALIAMAAGADFVKTSTGKNCEGATPEAFLVMAEAVRAYSTRFGRKVGLKAAGGIASTADAALYYAIVERTLGGEWLTPALFRIGASRLANVLLADICQTTGRELPGKVF